MLENELLNEAYIMRAITNKRHNFTSNFQNIWSFVIWLFHTPILWLSLIVCPFGTTNFVIIVKCLRLSFCRNPVIWFPRSPSSAIVTFLCHISHFWTPNIQHPFEFVTTSKRAQALLKSEETFAIPSMSPRRSGWAPFALSCELVRPELNAKRFSKAHARVVASHFRLNATHSKRRNFPTDVLSFEFHYARRLSREGAFATT